MINKKHNIIFSLSINFFFAFTIIIFGPYEIFISNSGDFNFTFREFWWMNVTVAFFYTITATLICSFLPKTLREIINLLIFSFTLCCYMQAMFLNSKMKVLIGEDINWDTSVVVTNTIIWFCLFIAVFLIKYFLKNSWKKIIQYLSIALIFMQLSGLIFLFLTTNILAEEKNGYLSQDGMLELSQDCNTIVFILDYFDGRTMDSILAENPDFLHPLEGFTYFPNATSVHSRTYPSITYLLTGNMCYFDQEPSTYVNTAFKSSTFLPALYNNQFDLGLYTFDYYIGNDVKNHIRNYVPIQLSLKFSSTIRYLIRIALYRDMPYLVKTHFIYDVNDINNNVISNMPKNIQTDTLIPEYKNFDDEWFYNNLLNNKLSLSDTDNVFRFYHLGSCHLNLSNKEPYAIRSLEIIYNYLDQMRNLGIYENSTIIITSDHGSSGAGDTLDLPQKTAVPLLIAKPSGTLTEELKVSNAPVSHTDFIPTILNGFSLDYSDYGETFFDIDENENRDRYYYYSALYSDEEGEIELREYKVSGDARSSTSYYFTGNTWDINYSANKVAAK